jgi:benzil reductase ((S)-benzoin forming)
MPRSGNPIRLAVAGATRPGQLHAPNLPILDISPLDRAADDGPVGRIVWITGASSGIGAALAATAPADARVIGVARRPSACAESIQADLSDPGEWPRVNARIRETLTRERPTGAALLHFAGVGAPLGAAASVDLTAYGRAAILNGVSGQVLGAGFLRSCIDVRCRASMVMCSSPAAVLPRSGLSQYCAGKAALEQWVRAVAIEEATRDDGAYVFAVVPYAVDTPMVRELMSAEDAVPLGAHFRRAADEHRLADPDLTAYEIWQLLDAGDRHGEAVAVGAIGAAPRPHPI